MDYEKAYTDALLRARQAIKDCGHNVGLIRMIEDIFPELAESEGEKIRKEIVKFLKENKDFPEDWIAWLEKQGEQKQEQYDIDVLEKHITKDSISELAHTVIVRNGWEIVDAKEQNSAWSDDDEKMLDDAIGAVYAADYYTYDDKQEIEHWLKSLKPQSQWKPTEEQMQTLEELEKQGKRA